MRISYIFITTVMVAGLLAGCAKTKDGEYVQWGLGEIERNTVSVVINSDINPPLVMRDIYALINLERQNIATVLIFDQKGVLLLRDPCTFSPMLSGNQHAANERRQGAYINNSGTQAPVGAMEPDAILQAVAYYMELGGTVLVSERSLCRNNMDCCDLPDGALCSDRIVFDALQNQRR